MSGTLVPMDALHWSEFVSALERITGIESVRTEEDDSGACLSGKCKVHDVPCDFRVMIGVDSHCYWHISKSGDGEVAESGDAPAGRGERRSAVDAFRESMSAFAARPFFTQSLLIATLQRLDAVL